jgi:energy-coupling factor transporter transmembrane protein EcfT
MALCSALQIAPRPPNVEFTSFCTFIVGLMEGTVVGAFFGSSVMLINGVLSPYGLGGLNIPFQMAGMIFAGVVGGVYRKFTHKFSFSARFSLETAILGAFIALVYDLITNLGYGTQLILAGENSSLALLTAVAYGSFFSLVHIASNSIVFGTLFLPLTNALDSLKVGKSPWSKKEHLYL